MTQTDLRGGCLCGQVRYRVSTAPRSSSVCHCISCRRAGGAQAVAWFSVDIDGFEWLSAPPAVFRSSASVERGFCARCGTPVSYRHAASPQEIELTNATLDDPDAVVPTAEIWLSEKIGWTVPNPALEHHARG
jgi:hypothetical protein